MKINNHQYWVYMMASQSGTLYIGVTGHLQERVAEHKSCIIEGFTKKYKCTKLVWFEETQYINNAIAREKQLKKWNRSKKESLIKVINPAWKDLADDWYENTHKAVQRDLFTLSD